MKNNNDHKIKIIPNGYTAVTPWIISPSSADLIEFLKIVFEAEEVPNSRITNEDGIIIHAVVKIGEAFIMLFDSRDGWAPTPSFLNLYVKDVEQTFKNAIGVGAKAVTDITELWFGERVCRILDPFGNLWWINQRVAEVDFTDPESLKMAATQEAADGIAYIQKSLDEAMKEQKKNFKY
ncbi:VOC family protein [Flavobacterium sp.]|uniref:VOC family protein n=1 Tax=Flavobacterium sp. TaxID=239 RepID=UPI003264565D